MTDFGYDPASGVQGFPAGFDWTKALGFNANSASPGVGAPAAVPGSNGLGSLFSGSMGQIGGNAGSSGMLGLGQLGLSGIGTLGNLWTAMGAMNLANQQFDFSKKIGTANLDNSVQSYNTALADRETSRAVQNNQSPQAAKDYIAANKLTTGNL